MTREMTFECLLVSHDINVFSTMHRVLRDFSVTTKICLTASKAIDLLAEGGTDLIVIDWDSESSMNLLQEAWTSKARPRPTVIAVAREEDALPAGVLLLPKPVDHESGRTSMRAAYLRMVRDFRRFTRYALMTAVIATDGSNRELALTITDLGDGGVGLRTTEKVSIGDILSFSLTLPGTQTRISIQARVLWTREYGTAGCEFVRVPPADLEIMLEWLRSRCRIKAPLIDVESAV